MKKDDLSLYYEKYFQDKHTEKIRKKNVEEKLKERINK